MEGRLLFLQTALKATFLVKLGVVTFENEIFIRLVLRSMVNTLENSRQKFREVGSVGRNFCI